MTNAKRAKHRTAGKKGRKAEVPGAVPANTPRTIRNTKVVTREDARAQLIAQGLSVAQWAKHHGVAYEAARKVLAGHNAGNFGEAHKVAVLLKIKAGTAVFG